jgi:hypothetical protein
MALTGKARPEGTRPRVRLYSGPGKDLTHRFPGPAAAGASRSSGSFVKP